MKIESGQIIVVASRARIRRIPASILALRAVVDFDDEAAMRHFVYDDLAAGGRSTENGRVEKRALDFINWAIRHELVELTTPMAAIWDLDDMGDRIGAMSSESGA